MVDGAGHRGRRDNIVIRIVLMVLLAVPVGRRPSRGRVRRMLAPRASRLACALAASLAIAGCGEQNRYVAPPPPQVSVAEPVRKAVTRYLEATGSTVAVNQADLVARVPGFVQGISYKDGAEVKAGTLLFTIEPEPYKVKVEQAQAAELGANATLKQAQLAYDRQVDLVAKQASPQAMLDQATATRDSAQSTVQQSQANTRIAEINQDYTRVTAPFDGVVSARKVSLGEYVGGNSQPTVLATIVQLQPIWVNFNIAESDVLRIRADMAARGLTRDDAKGVLVEIATQTDVGYPHVGTLDYVAPSLTASTGTLAARAVVANERRTLLPGLFVRVRVPIGRIDDALLVPDAAIGSDQSGRYLLVVGPDGTVEQRKVTIGPEVGDLRVVESGLAAQDRVVVAGALRAVPGQKVDPRKTTLTPPADSAPAAPARATK
jgi:RND family efflux transporter MFP subunit